MKQAFSEGWRAQTHEANLHGMETWNKIPVAQRNKLKRWGLVFDATRSPLVGVHASIPAGQREVDVQKIRKCTPVYATIHDAEESGNPFAKAVCFAMNSGDGYSDIADFDYRDNVGYENGQVVPDTPELKRNRLKKVQRSMV